MNRRALLATALALAVVGATTLTTAATGTSQAVANVHGPDPAVWENCDAPDDPDPPGFECAAVEVPLDHADPGGTTIWIEMKRLPAAEPGQRVGTLFINPGGPGASGIEWVEDLAVALGGPMRDRFDIIGFDPRGVGASGPAPDCAAAEPTVDPDEVGWQAYFDQTLPSTAAHNTACAVSVARYGQFLGTNQVVEDLEWLRIAVGDEPLNYWGASYGTRIGEVYAQRHPHNVRAMLLDGSVDPHTTVTTFESERGGSYDDAFGLFADTFAQAGEEFEELYDVLSQGPVVVTIDGEPDEVTLANLLLAVWPTLGSEQAWPDTVDVIADMYEAVIGGGEMDMALTEVDDPLTPPLPLEPGATGLNPTVLRLVNCIDLPEKPTVAEMVTAAEQMVVDGPYFGAILAGTLPMCAGLPVPEDLTPSTPPAGLGPVLVAGAVHDPATPYVWAERLHAFLPDSGLFTYEGAQHVSRILGYECIVEHTDTYLVDLTLPPPGTTCPFVPPQGPDDLL